MQHDTFFGTGQLNDNTGIATYIWLVTNRKPLKRKEKIQLIDATGFYKKMKKKRINEQGRNKSTDWFLVEQSGNFRKSEKRILSPLMIEACAKLELAMNKWRKYYVAIYTFARIGLRFLNHN